MAQNDLLRKLPSLDKLLRSDEGLQLVLHNGAAATFALREILKTARSEIANGNFVDIEYAALAQRARAFLDYSTAPAKVINATGIALHTNLGRAPLSLRAQKAVQNAMGYCSLEYDIATGERAKRDSAAINLLCKLTGAQDAMIVNNNAAALLLTLACLCSSKPTLISRGEMVEIGDSFRISDIMALGTTLCEVGATNRTHLCDYENAAKGAAAILKVHTSNYKINGFVCETELKDLKLVSKKYKIPLIFDAGSGAFLSGQNYSFDEPSIKSALLNGADIVTFSGDKLFGAAQSGIIVGNKKQIAKMRRHPLARCVRIDKLSLAAITATLEEYQDADTAKSEIPVLQMLCANAEDLQAKAKMLLQKIDNKKLSCKIITTQREIGGGCAPGKKLLGYGVSIRAQSAQSFARALREAQVPIIALVRGNSVVLDVSCISEQDFDNIALAVNGAQGK